MRVVVAGGHGKVAMLLHPMLRERGHEVAGLIRKPEQADDLRRVGADPVVCDVEAEDDITPFIGEADAVVFAAGAGPGSGAERKWTVDRDGAIKLIEAAKANGIRRYVMISAMDVENPRGEGVFRAYLQAKAEADEALRHSGLDYAIVRPGKLTNDEGSGRVTIGRDLPRGDIPRTDVAAVIAEVLEIPGAAGTQVDLTSGHTPIPEALQELLTG